MDASRTVWANVAMELVGTGILMSVITLAGTTLKEAAPFAVVPLLVALIYMGFELSGAHYNPAVTLTFYLRNRFSPNLSASYIAAQFFGGFCGASFATLISGKPSALQIADGYSVRSALLAELFFTTVLCFSILTITMRSNAELHPLFGSKFRSIMLNVCFITLFCSLVPVVWNNIFWLGFFFFHFHVSFPVPRLHNL